MVTKSARSTSIIRIGLGYGRAGRMSRRAHQYVRERSSRCCVLELGQAVAHLRGHGEVVLAFVAFQRLGERSFGLVSLAGGVQHLGEVAKRVSLVVEPVRALDDGNRFAGERFRLHMLATMSLNE